MTITESETTVPPPVGYSVLGFDIAIDAPAGTATNPIEITLRLDASAVPAGQDETTIQVLRNGVPLPDCTGAAGVASPDPCLASRSMLGDGDVQLVALTSAASLWQLAVTDAFSFTGFLAPVKDAPSVNKARAGQAVPLRFSLGGDYGVNILATDSPASRRVSCANGSVLSGWTAIASNGGLTFADGQYSIVWKTDKAWTSTCRELAVRLDDGSTHIAVFSFGK